VEEPTEELVEEPTEELAEEPTEELAEEPTEELAEEPTEEPTEELAEEPTEELAEEPTEEGRFVGTVKWFSGRKGYGFITRDEGKDVFVHFSAIRVGGPRDLNEGDKVEFSIDDDPRGPKAADLIVIEEAPRPSSDRW
jgi:CspA family cold shock protein